MRAQNESLRAPPWGCGAFRLLPVASLYFALPLAVSPAPCLTGNFSPRPTESDTPPSFILAVFADSLKSCLDGAPGDPGLRMRSPDPSAILSRLALMLAYKPPPLKPLPSSALENYLPTFWGMPVFLANEGLCATAAISRCWDGDLLGISSLRLFPRQAGLHVGSASRGHNHIQNIGTIRVQTGLGCWHDVVHTATQD